MRKSLGMLKSKGMRRRATPWLAFAMASALALLASPPPAVADSATCTYLGSPFRTVVVTIQDDGFGFIDTILVDGAEIRLQTTDCGAATIANTTGIVIADTSASATASVSINIALTKPFVGGFTDEPGGSDEVEFNVDLEGGYDEVRIRTTGTSEVIRLGTIGDDRWLNLNAEEADGVDADMRLRGVERLTGIFYGGHQDVRATGGAGTGDPFDLPIRFAGGTLTGDTLIGGTAADRIFGGRGDDTLGGGDGRDLVDGRAGSDLVRGGRGADRLAGYDGNDRLFGGSGADRLSGFNGRDRLFGGGGRDLLLGEQGQGDLCDGGPQRDRRRTTGCERVQKIP